VVAAGEGVVPGAESEARPESVAARTAQVMVSETRTRPAANSERRSWVGDAVLGLILNMVGRSPRELTCLPAAFNPGNPGKHLNNSRREGVAVLHRKLEAPDAGNQGDATRKLIGRISDRETSDQIDVLKGHAFSRAVSGGQKTPRLNEYRLKPGRFGSDWKSPVCGSSRLKRVRRRADSRRRA